MGIETVRRTVLPLAALVVAACSSSGDGGTQPGPTPAIAISLSTASGGAAQGGSTTLTATLTRSGGFTGTVTLSVQGAPAGVTGAVSNEQTSGGVTTATITIQVGAATVPGTYALTARGSGSGVSDATAGYSLTVTAAPGFTLSAQPATVSMAQGAAGNSTINIARTNGFAGTVSLTVQGAPAGMTATLTPAGTTGNSSVLALTAAANLAVGNYSLTITGVATGLTNQITTVQVTITAGTGGGSGNAVVDFTGCANQPLWFAVADGTGPWTVVPAANFKYQFSISSAKGSIAYVLKPSPTLNQVFVQHYTRSELTTSPIAYCASPPVLGTKLINGTLAGLGQGDNGIVSLGGISSFKNSNTAFNLAGVPNGPQDLIAWRHHNTFVNPDRGFIRRDVDLPTNGSVGTVDLTGAESFVPAPGIITLGGFQAGEALTHGVNYWSGPSCQSSILYNTQNASTNPFTAYGFPAALQRAGDFHQLNVTAVTGQGTPIIGSTSSRSIAEYHQTMVNRVVALPTELSPVTTTVVNSGYRRMQGAFTIGTEYTTGVTFQYTATGTTHFAIIGATAGWVGGTSVVLGLPDFTALAGWTNSWGPPTTGTGTWGAYATGLNIAGVSLCQENLRFVTATRLGTY